jgi:hypothetical protein
MNRRRAPEGWMGRARRHRQAAWGRSRLQRKSGRMRWRGRPEGRVGQPGRRRQAAAAPTWPAGPGAGRRWWRAWWRVVGESRGSCREGWGARGHRVGLVRTIHDFLSQAKSPTPQGDLGNPQPAPSPQPSHASGPLEPSCFVSGRARKDVQGGPSETSRASKGHECRRLAAARLPEVA